jgi:hypothetical protein
VSPRYPCASFDPGDVSGLNLALAGGDELPFGVDAEH